MSKKTMTALVSAAAACVCGAAASGGMVTGQLYTVPQAGEVSISFRSQSAGATGSLYFLGFEDEGGLSYTSNTDGRALGQFLFSNHGSSLGSSLLLGTFNAGDKLHFAYIVTKGVSSVPTGTTSRTDVAGDRIYFGLEGPASRGPALDTVLSVEDIKDPSKTDWDYNDFTATITSIPIPAPGPVALASLGMLLMAPRRKQRG